MTDMDSLDVHLFQAFKHFLHHGFIFHDLLKLRVLSFIRTWYARKVENDGIELLFCNLRVAADLGRIDAVEDLYVLV